MDDFKDLVWTSSTSSNPSSQTKAQQPSAPKSDAFAFLATGSQANRGTPNYLSSGPPSRSLTPSIVAKQSPPVGATPGSGDAFSGLLNFGGSSTSVNTTMSIAERQAQADRERREREQKQREHIKGQAAFWDKFDGPAGSAGLSVNGNGRASNVPLKTNPGGPSSKPPSYSTSNGATKAPTTFGRPITPTVLPKPSPSPAPSASTKPAVSVWDFDLLNDKPSAPTKAPPPAASSTPANDLLSDFDLLGSTKPTPAPARKAPSRQASPPTRKASTPEDFDWGDREDGDGAGLLDNSDDDHDDVLGMLSKPVQQQRTRQSTADSLNVDPPNRARSTSPRPPQGAGRSPRSSSPPPHVLGQLIEMGFSIQQARVALAATDSGVDVQAAMEILLAQTVPDDEGADEPSRPRNGREDAREREEAERRRRQQARRQGPSRAAIAPATNGDGRRDSPRPDQSEEGGPGLGQLADHADKVIAQASEIGANLFSKANAFWKTANKVIEERTKVTPTPPNAGPSKPRWMAEDVEEPRSSPGRPTKASGSGGFKDDSDDEDHPEDPVLPPHPKQANRRPEQNRKTSAPKADVRTGSLFDSSGAGASTYVSPYRRQGRSTAEPAALAPSAPTRSAPPPAPVPSRPSRTYVTCPPSTLSTSTTHRTAGTAAYKLGQFANAEAEFGRAIDVLPSGHMQLVPLWNNRAMSRLKTGDGPGAIADCCAVLEVVGPDWKVGDDAVDAGGAHGAGVDLGEALVKAFTRRAMAYEMGEKWDKAKEDWERLAGIGGTWGASGAKVRAEAIRGLDRCRKMASGDQPKPAPKRKPTAPTPRRPPIVTGPSEATARLQAANKAADADEAERYRLKDSVDSRLVSWKGGKETNIRALIASLENVLWPELGWAKVGMADLITEQQVKIRYMKAIAKLHPDKLRNATVEHQMIANGVFGALNEAYNVFKP